MDLENIHPPNNPDKFFPWLKEMSERYWETIEINRGIFGFQIQKATKWLPGLSDEQIAEYEKEMGFSFREVYKLYLRQMNGTDLPTINIYGECGEPYRCASGYYSYPRDLTTVKETIKWVHEEFGVTPEFIEENKIPRIMPIVSHRFFVVDQCAEAPVLSMYGRDSIFYAPSLESFLVNDIFKGGRITIVADDSAVEVKFWLDDEAATNVIEAEGEI
ncbi:MAG TPA: SMI1/KNR4 family protein [Pyrinomonadaceae bacterium]|nr:SMI1/KNR4 family protein [Pyrinomonadaceae bacterium]